MEKYPIVPVDGYKLTLEEVAAGWRLAGVAPDKALASTMIPLTEASARAGWLVPEVDGSLVRTNGATGKVTVRAFTGIRSPLTSATETQRDLMTADYRGADVDVTTPLPASGSHRWDLLYAIVADADSDSAARFAQDTTTGVNSSGTYNTRRSSTVTLAWVLGTSSTTATDPYPAGSWPALPAAAAGQAHIPLAYVHVHYSATPATVTYDIDRIWNCAPIATQNPGTGACTSHLAPCCSDGGGTARKSDPKSLTTGPSSANGGWGPLTTDKRPIRAFDAPAQADRIIRIPLNFGAGTWNASWQVMSQPVSILTRSDPLFPLAPIDFRSRWFDAILAFAHTAGGTPQWAHDRGVVAGSSTLAVFPTSYPLGGSSWGGTADLSGVVQANAIKHSVGQSIREDGNFNTDSGLSGYYLAAYWKNVAGVTAGAISELAVLVKVSDGSLYIAAKDAGTCLNSRMGVIKLTASGHMGEWGV